MLQIRDVHASYGPVQVLEGISLKVERGQTVALLGRNGVGKTTLVHTVMGVVPLRSGAISFVGRKIGGLPMHKIAGMGIALVPQGRRIFPSLTVRENVTLGIREPRQGAVRWDLERLFELFPVLRERQHQFGNALSGGEQQMLACARALAASPDLLLMDEPSEGLAPQKLRELGDLLERLNASGLAVLLVEQNMRFALRYSNHVYVMHRGGIGFDGSPAALFEDTAMQARLLAVGTTEQE
jgi:branched-chain amino acid transport system ATP-binding protein